MRYTIEGFSQAKLIDLKLDGLDAIILRWFVDFQSTGKMAIIPNNGNNYYWVNYKAVIKDMPILGIKSAPVLYRRFKKYKESGLMFHHTKREGGTFSCYRLNPDVYSQLVSYNGDRHTLKFDPPIPKSSTGNTLKFEQKTLLLKDSSTKKINKDVSKETPHKHLMKVYSETFEQLFHRKPTIDGKQGMAMKNLIAKHSPDELEECIIRYLHTKDDFYHKQGYSLAFLQSCYDSVMLGPVPSKSISGAVEWLEDRENKE